MYPSDVTKGRQYYVKVLVFLRIAQIHEYLAPLQKHLQMPILNSSLPLYTLICISTVETVLA